MPNMASAFIFDIVKWSPGQGPDWSLLEYKMQTCAFWGAGGKLAVHSACTGADLPGRASESWGFCAGSYGYEVGQKQAEHEIWSLLSFPPRP